MAELAVAAFGAISSAFTASAPAAASAAWMAGTTVTTAAGVTTSLAGAGSGVLSALQGVATIGSMASTLIGGLSAYREGQNQAMFADINAEADRLEAREQSLRIRRDLVQKVGANRVAFAASGLDISSGDMIESALGSEAEFETGLIDAAGRMRAAGSRATASSYRSKGVSGLVGAAGKAVGQGLRFGIDIANRG